MNNGDDKDNFRLCRLKILQIGGNYPCARDVPKSLDKTASTILSFDTGGYTGEEKSGSYEFKVIF